MTATPESQGLHDLLPAYVAGTLDADATARFREHLDACLVCRRELEFLQRVQVGAAAHGAELFAEHPGADDIVAVATGEDVGVADESVRRHLELCAACAAEVTWVRGEASPESRPVRPTGATSRQASWSSRLGWVAAAAAVVVLGMVLTLRPGAGPADSVGGIGVIVDLERSTRARPDVNVGVVPSTARFVILTVPVDLPARAFPATVEVIRLRETADAVDDVVLNETLRAETLDGGEYVTLYCATVHCTAGRYVVRVAAGTDHEQRVPFELVAPSD